MSGQYGAAKAALIFDTERWALEFVRHPGEHGLAGLDSGRRERLGLLPPRQPRVFRGLRNAGLSRLRSTCALADWASAATLVTLRTPPVSVRRAPIPTPFRRPSIRLWPALEFPEVALHLLSFPRWSVVHPIADLARSVPQAPAVFPALLVRAPPGSALPARPALHRDDARLGGRSRTDRMRDAVRQRNRSDYAGQQ